MNDREHVLQLLLAIFRRFEQAKDCVGDKEYCMRILDSVQDDLAVLKEFVIGGRFD